jgi:uroporphyrinogen-III synthase
MDSNGISVLSTRQLDKELIQKAAAQGINIDCRAFIHTHSIDSADLRKDVNTLATQNITVVFTSYNAVKAVALMVHEVNWDVYCISGRTENAVRNQLKGAKIKASTANAKELVAKIAKDNITEVLFFSGDMRLPDLPDGLNANSVNVKEIVVYHTKLTPVEIEKKYDGIAFFSPSAVQSFFTNNQLTEDVPCFTIGSTTASALKAYKNPAVLSPSADAAAMVDTIIQYYKKINRK